MFGFFMTSQPKATSNIQTQQPGATQMVIPSQAPPESQQTQSQTKAPLRLRGGGNFIKDCFICCLCCCALEDICVRSSVLLCPLCRSSRIVRFSAARLKSVAVAATMMIRRTRTSLRGPAGVFESDLKAGSICNWTFALLHVVRDLSSYQNQVFIIGTSFRSP
ncbi:uncharacterized protein EI90DRAFT_3078587 [Cantharellus anzutake]|uniref:uncharacterized protein n=1 Tax=Cantharellus anzutake TaxID=1750568 RepID=UPI00190852DC|nr:uncharacterized protein EI90DRAFT_3078587 [Cantharellus anzutake]KAF8321936.1 hypothetical protein EI90DRAFT_3078587 [Cantharellus anzutake]